MRFRDVWWFACRWRPLTLSVKFQSPRFLWRCARKRGELAAKWRSSPCSASQALPLLLICVALLACGCASTSVRLIEMEGGTVSTCRRMQYNVVDAVIWLDGKLPGAKQ